MASGQETDIYLVCPFLYRCHHADSNQLRTGACSHRDADSNGHNCANADADANGHNCASAAGQGHDNSHADAYPHGHTSSDFNSYSHGYADTHHPDALVPTGRCRSRD